MSLTELPNYLLPRLTLSQTTHVAVYLKRLILNNPNAWAGGSFPAKQIEVSGSMGSHLIWMLNNILNDIRRYERNEQDVPDVSRRLTFVIGAMFVMGLVSIEDITKLVEKHCYCGKTRAQLSYRAVTGSSPAHEATFNICDTCLKVVE